MNSIFSEIGKYRIVPVIKIENAENAVSLADALTSGGLPFAEVTFRNNAPEESFRMITDSRTDIQL